MLLKLSEGNYINTELIGGIKNIGTIGHPIPSALVYGKWFDLTDDDIDKIVKVMANEPSQQIVDQLDNLNGNLGTIYGGLMEP